MIADNSARGSSDLHLIDQLNESQYIMRTTPWQLPQMSPEQEGASHKMYPHRSFAAQRHLVLDFFFLLKADIEPDSRSLQKYQTKGCNHGLLCILTYLARLGA